jgi:hypothetical protein
MRICYRYTLGSRASDRPPDPEREPEVERLQSAVYRAAAEADFAVAHGGGADAAEGLVWLTVYRKGPLSLARVAESARYRPRSVSERSAS